MQKFLRTLTLLAFLAVPWVMQGQNANVSEYDMSYSTAAYSSVTGNTLTFTNGEANVTMPFDMYFGTTNIASGTTLTVKADGSVSFAALAGSYIAPMKNSSDYTGGTVKYSSSASKLTIEWRKVTKEDNSYSFQLCLYPSGNIEFRYGPMTLNSPISVLVGMKAVATDYFRLRGEGGTNYWNSMERVLNDATTRTLSATYHPAYDLATGIGAVYTFTLPACVKPTLTSATATAWNKVTVAWSRSENPDNYQVAYSTNPQIDFATAAASEYTIVSGTIAGSATSKEVTVSAPLTAYYFAVRAKCGSNYSAWSNVMSATTPTGCTLVTGVNASEVAAHEATLGWTAVDNATRYDVRYNAGENFDPATAGTEVTTTTTSKTLTGLTGSTTYYYYVRTYCQVSGQTTDWVGPYTFTTPASCLAPTNLTVASNTENSVTLSWTESGTATAWQVGYGLFTTDDDYVIVNATTNPFTVSNLGLGEWYFFVRSNCAADDNSAWAGPVSHTFGYCNPSPTSVDGQGITNITFGNDLVVNDNTPTGTDYYQNHSDMMGDLYIGAESQVSITYKTGYSYGTKIWIDFNNDLDFDDPGEQVYSGLSSSSNPTTLVATFTIPVGTAVGDYRMRIGGTDDDSGPDPCYTGSWGCLRDYTVRVVAAPSCFLPGNLSASNVTSTSATLTWVESGLSTQWEVKYGPSGFDITEEGVSVIVNTTPSLALDYLDMGVAYDAYVRSLCNPEGPTDWSNKTSFTTSFVSCLAYSAPGEEQTVTIGEGTSTNSYLPSYSYYNYSLTEQIYTAQEIGGAGVINSIALNFGGQKNRTVDIYLVETEKSSFSSASDWVAVTAADKVYTGALCDATGWVTYQLTTPFVYSGNGNLLLVIDDNTGSWVSGLNAYVSNATAQALRVYSDGTNYDPINNPSYSGTVMNVKNNIQLGIQYTPCVSYPVYAPDVEIALSETEYAATLTFTNNNESETNPTYGIIWGPQGFNPATAGTTVSPISTNTYTLNNLTQLTTYDVYVYAIASDNRKSDTVRYAFTTPFHPNCPTPVIDGEYGASNITYNTATLTWRQPGDVPESWTVRYAAADFDPATAAATS